MLVSRQSFLRPRLQMLSSAQTFSQYPQDSRPQQPANTPTSQIQLLPSSLPRAAFALSTGSVNCPIRPTPHRLKAPLPCCPTQVPSLSANRYQKHDHSLKKAVEFHHSLMPFSVRGVDLTPRHLAKTQSWRVAAAGGKIKSPLIGGQLAREGRGSWPMAHQSLQLASCSLRDSSRGDGEPVPAHKASPRRAPRTWL